MPRLIQSLMANSNATSKLRANSNDSGATRGGERSALCEALVALPRIHNRFGWKFWAFISGGAALDAETEEFWRRLGFVVIQGYGLTETTSLITLNHPFRTGKRSIGKVLEGREIKLDAHGEILVRGDNVAAGYWQSKQGSQHSTRKAGSTPAISANSTPKVIFTSRAARRK